MGNYLDAHDGQYIIGSSSNKTIEEVVNLWGNSIFNLKCFDELKRCGFNCVRLPVTWCNFIQIKNKKLSISAELINHLKEIIDYAISKDFIVILDMHHDDKTWLDIACSNKEFKQVKKQFLNIWKVVSFQFKNFNNNLIFEGMNEIINRHYKERDDWWGHYNLCFKRINALYKVFVKTARKFNKTRTLMISTYGAQIHHNALKHFKMVKDENVIVDLHFYIKEKEQSYLKEHFKFVFEDLISKNIPIFMGEIGVKKAFVQDFDLLKNYVDFLNLHNIKYALWDNGSNRCFINRETAKFSHLELKKQFRKN